MKLLVVHPGASYSTHDVYAGLAAALQAQGHTIYPYLLDARIEAWGTYLRWLWRRKGRPEPRPSSADTFYRAGVETLERALRWNVDGVLVISAMYLHPDVLVLMRRAGLRVGIVFTESPYDDEKQAKVAQYADVCWTNERTSAARYDWGYLPAAYDPARHRPFAEAGVDDDVPAHDVVFVGSAFQERIDLLGAVDWSGIDLGLYGAWEALPSRHPLRKHLSGRVVDNATAAALYRRARVGLNLYRSSQGWGKHAPRITHAESLNPRAYELAACGVFQLSDHRAEVAEVFGDAVPTFGRPEELSDLLRDCLADEPRRRDSARRAREAVAAHTFAARAAQVSADLARAWQLPRERSA